MTIKNNTPRIILNGIKDESIVALVPEPEQIPLHLPLLYIQAEKGPLEPTLVGNGDLTRIYGDGTIDVRKQYMNHATLMAATCLDEGNSVLIKRVVSPTTLAASRTLTLTVDKTLAIINEYDRDVDGSVILDVNGDPTFAVGPVPIVNGASLKWAWVDTSVYDTGSGVYVFATTGTGDIITYPILTIDAAHVGLYGNNIGIRLWMAGPTTSDPGDTDIIDDQASLIYRAQLVSRQDNNTTVLVEDLFGSGNVEFSFKPNAYNNKTNVDLDIQQLVDNYTDDGVSTQTSPTYGPLGKVTVHQTHLDAVLTLLLAVENVLAPAVTTEYLLDIFGGVDFDGIHHYGFQIDNTGDLLTQSRTQYLTEGADGDLTLATYDAAVGVEISTNYQNAEYPLVDSAKYPFSALYDSGYSIATKKILFKWLGYRKDVHVTVGTFVVGEDPLTVMEEISVAIDLRSSAAVYAESDVHGTGVTRVVIIAQSGNLITSSYKDKISLVFEIAKKRARYMGAGNGKLKPGLGYDNFPLNTVDSMKNINNTWRTNVAKEASWSAGINYVQYVDRQTLFFPGLQTIYSIKNSILVSEILMQIAVDVTKMSDIVWRMLTGNTDLSKAQFIERSNELLLELVANKYDGRVTIIPNTYFTAADSARGYSWTQDVSIFGENMKTVATVNVITRRSEDL